MKEIYQLIIKGEAFKRLIITRTTVTLVNDGTERSTSVEIYNEPVNTFDLIKKIEQVINTPIKVGEYEISPDDVKKFIS